MVSKEKNTNNTWMFPKIGVPQNGWFIMENLTKMDDLEVPIFLETPHSSFIKSMMLMLLNHSYFMFFFWPK